MSTDGSRGAMPNRQHYLKAALIGGGASALLSVVPVVNWLNIFFFCLIIAGGIIAMQQVQTKTGTVSMGEGAIIGALSGLACGAMLFVLGLCLSSAFALVFLPDASNREGEELITGVMLMLGGSCCMGLIIYPAFGGLGGLIGALIWPAEDPSKDAPDQVVPGGGVLPAAPRPEDIAKRKRMIRIVLGTLGGCFGVMVGFCAFCGYLAILENRGPVDTAGEDEVASVPLVLGEMTSVTIPGTGDYGTRRFGVWLVADDDLPPNMRELEGTMACNAFADVNDSSYMRNIYTYRGRDEGEPAWLFLDQAYAWDDDFRCMILINELPPGISNPRIVITQLTRPSDWFD